MSLVSCRECGNQVSTEADACPRCGVPLPRRADPTFGLVKSVAAGAGALFVGFCTVVAILNVRDPNARKSAEPTPIAWDAKYECQTQVRARLRSPRTARFSDRESTDLTPISDHAYRVIGWVDAQNGFGAEIRTPYVCRAHWLGGTTWVVDSLRFVER